MGIFNKEKIKTLRITRTTTILYRILQSLEDRKITKEIQKNKKSSFTQATTQNETT